MRKRLLAMFICTVGVALTSVATAGIAAAAPPPKTGCPGGFQLTPLDKVLAVADPAFVDAIIARDKNGDELLPEAVPLFDPTFLFDDNKFPNP
jgi:hypothetical protein